MVEFNQLSKYSSFVWVGQLIGKHGIHFFFSFKYCLPSLPSLAFAELNTLDCLYAVQCKLDLCAVYVGEADNGRETDNGVGN